MNQFCEMQHLQEALDCWNARPQQHILGIVALVGLRVDAQRAGGGEWAGGLAAQSYASCFWKLTHRRTSAYLSHWSQDMRLMQTNKKSARHTRRGAHGMHRGEQGGGGVTKWRACGRPTQSWHHWLLLRPAVSHWLLNDSSFLPTHYVWPCRPYKAGDSSTGQG